MHSKKQIQNASVVRNTFQASTKAEAEVAQCSVGGTHGLPAHPALKYPGDGLEVEELANVCDKDDVVIDVRSDKVDLLSGVSS